MISRTIFALAATLALLSAPAGAATTSTKVSAEAVAARPASILITVQLSPVAHAIAYQDPDISSGNVPHLPIYFAPGDTRPSEEAQLALAALADEAAVNASLLLTVTATGSNGISTDMQEARAVSVFNMLSTLGVPMRAMALDLNRDVGALSPSDMLANAI
ncbi:MAG: hypothetical protein COA62_06755 [Rhodobiaceae bacterium]|nr:MAG: hypothetical protein COA62_06755 [Rhodobiaceae bacterium]